MTRPRMIALLAAGGTLAILALAVASSRWLPPVGLRARKDQAQSESGPWSPMAGYPGSPAPVPTPAAAAPLVEPSGLRASETLADASRRPAMAMKASQASPSSRAAAQGDLALSPGLPGAALNAMSASQKLIRTGQFSLEVQAFDQAYAGLQRIVAEQGGYIAEVKTSRQDKGRAQGTVVLRVPPPRTFATLDALRGLGKVEREGVQTEDVTRAYADLEGRLRVKREMEGRLREILKSNTRTVQDLVYTEHQLFALLEEIERMEGEKRFLATSAGLSTLTIELHEPAFVPVAAPPPKRPSPVLEALKQGLENSTLALVGAVASLAYLLAFLLPWAAVGAAGWMVGRRILRRAKTRASEG